MTRRPALAANAAQAARGAAAAAVPTAPTQPIQPTDPTEPTAPPPARRAAVGRADLLRLLAALGPGQAETAAALTGFEPRPDDPPPESPSFGAAPAPAPQPPADARPATPAHHAEHYAVVSAGGDPTDDDAAADDGDLFNPDAPRVDPRVLQHPASASPAAQPLASPRRMAALLARLLRVPRESRQPDAARWVDLLAQARLPRRMPMRRRPGWCGHAGLLWHADAATQPLAADMRALCRLLHRLSAGRAPVLLAADDGHCYRWQEGARPASQPWRRCRTEAVDALSTLCVFAWPRPAPDAPAGRRGPPWLRPLPGNAARWPAQAVTLLLPRQAPLTTAALAGWPRATQVVDWDHGLRPRPRRPVPAAGDAAAQQRGTEALLALSALAVRVEPPLLRDLRLLLGLPAAAECRVWLHAEVQVCTGVGYQLAPAALAGWRARLLADIALSLRRAAAWAIRRHHRGLSPLVRMEEAGLAQVYAQLPAEVDPDRINWAAAARTLALPGADPELQRALAAFAQRAGQRADARLWPAVSGLAEAWLLAELDAVRAGAALPPGLPPAALRRVLGPRGAGMAAQALLVQRGDRLQLQVGAFGPPPQRVFDAAGPLRVDAGVLLDSPGGHTRWLAVPAAGVVDLARLRGPGPWTLRSAGRHVRIARLQRPAWASEWGADRRGVYAGLPPLGNWRTRLTVDASTPVDPESPLLPAGVDERDVTRGSAEGPVRWQTGIDRSFGAFADLTLHGVTQRFRYLAPGEFWMGSTDAERARLRDADYERWACNESPRHRVRLTQGFWLADTACTQALWAALMDGRNPSGFTGDERRPVEEVSWDDVQTFLQRLQPLLPEGCIAALPTEAQWEYACRAGTESAFSFGDNITPGQVNYDGNHPFDEAPKGLYRETTVPVASLPANPWGLCEMHGNVWEWCADDLRDYDDVMPGEVAQDPTGPQEPGPEAPRAVRGGSWIGAARNCRSAYRDAGRRGSRARDLGFRLALRSTSPAQGPEGRFLAGGPEGQKLAPGPEGRAGFSGPQGPAGTPPREGRRPDPGAERPREGGMGWGQDDPFAVRDSVLARSTAKRPERANRPSLADPPIRPKRLLRPKPPKSGKPPKR